MTETDIQQAAEEFGTKARALLAPPGQGERTLDALLAQIESQPGLSAAVRREARRALEGDRRTLRESRLLELGTELRRVLKPLGLELTARVVRRRRKQAKSEAAPQKAEQQPSGEGQSEREVTSW